MKRALVVALKQRDHAVEQQKVYPIVYNGTRIGEHRIDLLVDDMVVVEIKAISSSQLPPVCQAQLLSYLRLTKLLVGLLVNFGNSKLEIKRMQNKWEIERLKREQRKMEPS